MDDHAQRIAAEFRLNSDQRSVLQHCSLWATSNQVSIADAASLAADFFSTSQLSQHKPTQATYLLCMAHCWTVELADSVTNTL